MGDDGPQNILWGYLDIKVKDWHTHYCFNTITTPCFLADVPHRFRPPARSLWWFQKWPGKRPVCHSPPQCDPQPVGSWWQHGEIIRSQSWTKDMLLRFPYYTILWIYVDVYYTTFWGVAWGHETVCPNEWRWLFEILWHCCTQGYERVISLRWKTPR